jgi:hypothetical protein
MVSVLRRYVLGSILGLLGISVLAGCGGLLAALERLAPPGTFVSGGSSPFIGKWTQSSLTVSGTGQTVSCGSSTITVNGEVLSCDPIQRTYVNDGSFLDTAPTLDIGSGTWSIDSTGTILTTFKNNVSQTGTAVIDSAEYQTTVVTPINGATYSIVYTWLSN